MTKKISKIISVLSVLLLAFVFIFSLLLINPNVMADTLPNDSLVVPNQETGAIKIQVEDLNDSILYNANIVLHNSGGSHIIAKGSTESGAAIFNNLPVGSYYCVATAPEYYENKGSFEIYPNINKYLIVHLRKISNIYNLDNWYGAENISMKINGQEYSNNKIDLNTSNGSYNSVSDPDPSHKVKRPYFDISASEPLELELRYSAYLPKDISELPTIVLLNGVKTNDKAVFYPVLKDKSCTYISLSNDIAESNNLSTTAMCDFVYTVKIYRHMNKNQMYNLSFIVFPETDLNISSNNQAELAKKKLTKYIANYIRFGNTPKYSNRFINDIVNNFFFKSRPIPVNPDLLNKKETGVANNKAGNDNKLRPIPVNPDLLNKKETGVANNKAGNDKYIPVNQRLRSFKAVLETFNISGKDVVDSNVSVISKNGVTYYKFNVRVPRKFLGMPIGYKNVSKEIIANK